ncbi:hypothetical protein [Pelagibacterium luteolum]|uniref:Uncharacterized protein n=1 Tax=Pelagibacterium luteolum TaxID=440168 RepID=A0A1G7ZT49_9HYPH|nr:hypothetical protein [Pelagibacterium luteolum]SDH11844.1 hypothetical protein SAMN04487974_12245 [Pelagibacterium luteolum]
MTDKATRKTPNFIAYCISESENAIWTRIGAAWDHEDEKGLNLQLDLIPVNFTGRIVLREPKAKQEEGA